MLTRCTCIIHQISVLEPSLNEADKLLKRSTTAEIVQLKKSLPTIFQDGNQTEPIVHGSSSQEALVFVENQKMHDIVNMEKIGFLKEANLTKPIESLVEGEGLKEGTVARKAQFNLITRNAERKQAYDKRDSVTVEINKDKQGPECVTEVRTDDNKNGIYNISYYPRVQGTFKLLVTVNGEHVSGSPFTVIVKPFHVRPVLSFGKEGSGDGMFSSPRPLAVTDRDEIVVVDNGNHRVQVFDSNGTFLRSFGHHGKNAEEFIYPNGIAIDKDEKVFVADMGNHRVQILSWEGQPAPLSLGFIFR